MPSQRHCPVMTCPTSHPADRLTEMNTRSDIEVALARWSIDTVDVATPPAQSIVDISESGSHVTLVVGGLGSISVSADHCRTDAVNAAGHESLRAFAGDWAWGQRLALTGIFAFHGATLERDGYGIALVGPPRTGTTLAALALSRRGWRLVADGTCPFLIERGELVALPGRQNLEVDRAVTATLPADMQVEDAGTPRSRSRVSVASSGANRIDRIIELLPSRIRVDGVVVPGDYEESDPSMRLRSCSLVGGALESANPALAEALHAFCVSATETAPVDVAVVPTGDAGTTFTPIQIADLLSSHIDALSVPGAQSD